MARIYGTAGKDTLVGTAEYDIISGGADDDTIDGGASGDKMAGQDGNDTFIGGAGNDYMDGGNGVDKVDYSASTSGVKVFLGTGKAYGGQAEGDTLVNIENLVGTQYRDTLVGNNDANTLIGGRGDDALHGGEGNDVLAGHADNDTLSGGVGADTFVFTSANHYGMKDGHDKIMDFEIGVDMLEFRTAGWGGTAESLDDLEFSQAGNDTVIETFEGDTITLVGINLEQLMAHASTDFIFT